jgi:hypothetical protein
MFNYFKHEVGKVAPSTVLPSSKNTLLMHLLLTVSRTSFTTSPHHSSLYVQQMITFGNMHFGMDTATPAT